MMKDQAQTTFTLGEMQVRFTKREDGSHVQFVTYPAEAELELKKRRGKSLLHPAMKGSDTGFLLGEQMGDSLVQLHRRGDPLGFPASANAWSAGHTLRNSATTEALRFESQKIEEIEDGFAIRTTLSTGDGLACHHFTEWRKRMPGFIQYTVAENRSQKPIVLEMLSSFSLSGLSPFAEDDMPGRLKLHRFRSAWSLEGRHERISLEDLHLERYWSQGGCNNLRYGQVGSLPVRQFFPFIGLEDEASGVLWGAQIAWHGSWQMEISRRDDPISLSGGLADYDFGQWAKTLLPGETFKTPQALVASCRGSLDDLCHRLTDLQRHIAHDEPAVNAKLPIIFNEWCSSWGNPTHVNIVDTCDNLAPTPTGIFVIDDGWSIKPEGTFQTNGDWILNQKSFPDGLIATTRAIRDRGMIPGIWFEFEVVTEQNPAFSETDHLLRRHGHILQVGKRAYWDFRDPWTREYLRDKVIRLLEKNEFGYIKVDYNDSIGLGCDPIDEPTESLGEGLRQHLEAVAEFFREIRNAIPGIMIENCASGGHRLEPGMVALTTMSSFSDAHECLEIPIIAANLMRLIPAEKSQIWCVIRKADSEKRIFYGLAATFLGRMAISGDYQNPDPQQACLIQKAQEFYAESIPAFTRGLNRVDQSKLGKSYRYPEGWQVCQRTSIDQSRILLVVHGFERSGNQPVTHPLPVGKWKLSRSLDEWPVEISNNAFSTHIPEDFSGNVWLLEKQ